MAFLPIIGAIAGAGMQAMGAIQQGQANQAMYDYQAGIAQQNAQIDKLNAQYAIETGEQQAAQSGMSTRARTGEILAAQGSSGFDVGVGTTPEVRKSQWQVGQMEQAAIRGNAGKAAYDYDIGAFMQGEQAQADIAAGKNAATAGMIGAMGSIIGGAGNVASKWMQGTQYGLFNNNPFGF